METRLPRSSCQDICTQELYEDSVPNTQDEINARTSKLNSFATSFHESNVIKLQNLGKPVKNSETEFHYVVFCSQMIEKYLGLRFPDDPEQKKSIKE